MHRTKTQALNINFKILSPKAGKTYILPLQENQNIVDELDMQINYFTSDKGRSVNIVKSRHQQILFKVVALPIAFSCVYQITL